MANRIPPNANIPPANAEAWVRENQAVNPTAVGRPVEQNAPREVVAPQADRGTTVSQPRVNRMQQRAQKLTKLTDTVKLANHLLQLAYMQVSNSPNSVVAPRMLGPYSSLVRAVDELEAESSVSRRSIITDKSFAEVLIKRARMHDVILRTGDGAVTRAMSSMMTKLKSPLSFWQQYENGGFDSTPKLAEEVFQVSSLKLADLRRALELDPGCRRELSKLMSLTFGEAVIFKMTSLVNSTQQVRYKAADLESLIGAPATQLVRQSEMLLSVIGLFLVRGKEFLTDRWVDQMRPIAVDLSRVSLDLAACAMDLALPEPSSNHTVEQISQAKSLLDDTVGHCLDLSDLMLQWNVDHPRSGSYAAAHELNTGTTRKPGSFVSVRATNGVHVPAQVQSNGTLLTLGLNVEVIAPSSSSSMKFFEKDESQSDSETDSVSETRSLHASTRAARTLQKGMDLIASDFEKEFRQVTAGKGYTDPDILTPSYLYHAEKWQAQAQEMRSIADKLVNKFSGLTYDTEVQTQASRDLPDLLRERASALELGSRELQRPETRWSLIKGYVRPQARQWSELFAGQQIERVGLVTELASTTPNTVFEVRIQAKPDADGTTYPPVWLHLHSKKPMTLKQVSRAGFERFDAVHLKSDADKNRGRQWVQAERANGNFSAEVHRSEVNADLFKKIMSSAKP